MNTDAIKTMEVCVNRIIVEGLYNSGYKRKREDLCEDGENPEYIEVTVDGRLTNVGIENLKKYVSNESNHDADTLKELDVFLSSIPSEEKLNTSPIVVFWNEN